MNPTQPKLAFIIRKLRDRRTTLNYSQAQVASRLGISQNAYSKIEAGLTNFSLARLYEIAEILQVDVKELV